MVLVPGATPVTTPEEKPTVATDVLLLDHVPPETALLKEVFAPTHAVRMPVMLGVVRLPASINTPESYSLLPASAIVSFRW
jgi:hypothetical protein